MHRFLTIVSLYTFTCVIKDDSATMTTISMALMQNYWREVAVITLSSLAFSGLTLK